MRHRFRLVVLLAVVVLTIATSAVAQDEAVLARHGLTGTALGYVLFDALNGETLAAREADRSFIPASVAKVPTIMAAMAILGPDHRFATSIHAGGPVRDGVVQGDLILKGGGDPSLTTEGLVDLAEQLRRAGVTGIGGRFLFDAGSLPELPEIDAGQPWTAGYNTGVSALSLNYNRFQLVRTPTPGAWAVADVGRHPIDSIRVELSTAGTYPADPVGPDRWRITPGGPARSWLPVMRPAVAAASVFRRVAGESGIVLPPPLPGAAPAGSAVVAIHRSPPLAEIARQVLRYSNNLSAELVGLAAARRLDPRVTNLAASAAVLSGWLIGGMRQEEWRGMSLVNHSGLSSASRITPRQMAGLLRAAGPAIWSLLPGEEDGLTLPQGVRAKSGTLAYAKGLAGTLTRSDGRNLGFVLFIGDDGARRALDAGMDRRMSEMPADARDWLARARAAQAELLALWATAR